MNERKSLNLKPPRITGLDAVLCHGDEIHYHDLEEVIRHAMKYSNT